MKNLLARGRRVVDDLRYHLDNFFTRGVSAQFTILFGLMMALVVFGTISLRLGLYRPENKDVPSIGHKFGEGFWDAAWWSLMHIFDPSYVSQDYGANAAVVILALVISMLGLILFGGVIGLVSAGVERKLDELAGGDRPVREAGHLLILGWNEKIFSILDLFEDYHKPVKVVILSNHAIADMQEMLRTRRGRVKRVKPVLRTGSPTNLGELERMAFRDAYSIIVLADDSHTNPDEEPDLLTIKTVMLLASHVGPAPRRPKMVAELVRREHLEVANVASRHAVSFVCSSEVLSRMIVQSARQPGLSRVYVTLFGFAGNEIYVQAHQEGAGRNFGDLIFDYPNAVVIGTSSTEQRDGEAFFRQHMNPGRDHVVGTDEWLILIADSEHIVRHRDSLPPPAAESIAIAPREFLREHVLILGWNSNIYTVLREYDSFLQAGSEITIAAHHTPEAARALLDDELRQPLSNATVTYVQSDYTLAARLESLLTRTPDTCVILADESSGERDPDARTIVAILLLKDFEARTGRRFKQIVAEVLSAANAELLQQHGSTETIISPQLISMLLAQISQQLMLDRVYADLMNARANEIYLKNVSRYTNRPGDTTFADLMVAASNLGELAIGVKIDADSEDPAREFGVRLNPHKREPLHLVENDKVIVISGGGRKLPLS